MMYEYEFAYLVERTMFIKADNLNEAARKARSAKEQIERDPSTQSCKMLFIQRAGLRRPEAPDEPPAPMAA